MEAREANMEKLIKARGADCRNLLLTGLFVVALGAGTATAAISLGSDSDAGLAARPLTTARGLALRPAPGPASEDCVRVTRRGFAPDGRETLVHTLECAE
jgi:hypothetical protein